MLETWMHSRRGLTVAEVVLTLLIAAAAPALAGCPRCSSVGLCINVAGGGYDDCHEVVIYYGWVTISYCVVEGSCGGGAGPFPDYPTP